MLLEEKEMVSPSSDRRIFDRFPARFPAKFKDTRDDFGTKVSLQDASAAGVTFATTEHLYRNDSVALEVELPNSHDPLSLKGRVVWVKHLEANMWEAGLEFYRPQLLSLWRLYHLVESNLA